MKNNVLHPYFLESQPEKAENRIFFIGSDKAFFDKIQTHKICQNLGPASNYIMKIKKPVFFVQNLAHSMRYFFGPRGQNFWILIHGQNRGSIRGPKMSVDRDR